MPKRLDSTRAAAWWLGQAAVHAGAKLGLDGQELARALGLDGRTLARVRSGEIGLDLVSPEGELAAQLVCVCRIVDGLVSGQDVPRRAWVRSHVDALGAMPSELIGTPDGLFQTLMYLEGVAMGAA